ncbi:hypothetical protein DSM19430T_12960 [Desulfovibrio psychrotolerans]|uniref:Uncharacterized protein n=1 Tax=Desulfovibrio psychrotolerans TaxID=415242 RepID=A0A7J0BTX2_9BACT|nr:hypothetical protein DSM19430T_12960 [Desulfovibrio psychrotolerans]
MVSVFSAISSVPFFMSAGDAAKAAGQERAISMSAEMPMRQSRRGQIRLPRRVPLGAAILSIKAISRVKVGSAGVAMRGLLVSTADV